MVLLIAQAEVKYDMNWVGVIFQCLKFNMEKWLPNSKKATILEIAQMIDIILCYWFLLEGIMVVDSNVERNLKTKTRIKYILLSFGTMYPLFSTIIRKDNICKWEFNKFSNVLIKKIPSELSPCHDVNQKIEVVLGLALPSKAFYKFNHKKLEELKSQINDSMERNYIRLSKLPSMES